MKGQKKISYVIRQSDNLYQISRYYHTTVPALLALNPKIDPYDLKAGSVISVLPGISFTMPHMAGGHAYSDTSAQFDLLSAMRKAWVQHVYWSRMLLISIAARLSDEQDVSDRLLMNPTDIAAIFSNYYKADTVNMIEELLTEHLQIGARLIAAMRDETADEEELKNQWYINADKMADVFSGAGPFYTLEEVHKMLYNHLDLFIREASLRLAGNYADDIDAFDAIENAALEMADYFSRGLMRQFPQKF